MKSGFFEKDSLAAQTGVNGGFKPTWELEGKPQCSRGVYQFFYLSRDLEEIHNSRQIRSTEVTFRYGSQIYMLFTLHRLAIPLSTPLATTNFAAVAR
jgi:hypothetical protein